MYGIVDLLMQSRLRRNGFVRRREEKDMIQKRLKTEVKGKLPKGRFRKRWLDNVRKDTEGNGFGYREDYWKTLLKIVIKPLQGQGGKQKRFINFSLVVDTTM